MLPVRRALFLEQMMYRRLRAIHLSTALFAMAFLLAYAIGALEFAHRQWLPRSVYSTHETGQMTPRVTDARVLARQWRGELQSVENSPGFLKFRVMTSLGRSYDVSYSITTGETAVKTTTNSFLNTLVFIHVSHGIWACAAALVSLAMLTLGVTGVYLWFKDRSSRRIGGVLLAIGVTTAFGLIISMRGG
jgi:hypothetical protein